MSLTGIITPTTSPNGPQLIGVKLNGDLGNMDYKVFTIAQMMSIKRLQQLIKKFFNMFAKLAIQSITLPT